jgi:hypothetical protein
MNFQFLSHGKEPEPHHSALPDPDLKPHEKHLLQKKMYTRLITAELILLLRYAPAVVSGRFNVSFFVEEKTF